MPETNKSHMKKSLIPEKNKYYIAAFEVFINLVPLAAMSTLMLLAGLGVFGESGTLFIVAAIVGYAASILMTASIIHFIRNMLIPIYRMGTRFFRLFNNEEKDIILNASNGNYTGIVMNSVDLFGGKKSVYDRAAKMEEIFAETSRCSDNILFRNNVGNDEFILTVPDRWKEKYKDIDVLQVDVIPSRVHAGDRGVFDETFETLKRKSGRHMNISVRFRVTPKQFINVSINARSILSSAEEVIIVGAIVDTNSISELENIIREKYLMYHFTLQAVTDIIYEIDIPEDLVTITNPNRYIELFGDTQEGKSYTAMHRQYNERVHPDYREEFFDRFCSLDHLLYMPEMRMSYEYKVSNKNKEWVWVRHTLSCIKAENGHATKVIGLITDINERRYNDMKKLYDTQHDSETGVYLKSVIEREYNDERAAGNLNIAVMLVKITNYKQLFARSGTSFTASAMRLFANLIWVNQIDKCSVGRFDDDVFMILLKDMSMSGAAKFLGNRLIRAAKMPLEVNGTKADAEIVVGSATLCEREAEYASTLARALDALCKAKQQGVYTYYEIDSELCENQG